MTVAGDPLRDLEAIIHDIAGRGIPDAGVLVEIEAFFEGNDDPGSIAPNLLEHPGLALIRRTLLGVRERPDVVAVLINVMVEWEEYPKGEWPFAQSIVVVTSAMAEEVDSWVVGLSADPSFEVDVDDGFVNPPAIPDGARAVTVWWD